MKTHLIIILKNFLEIYEINEKVQPIDQSCLIKFRSPEFYQASSLQNFSHVFLISRSEPAGHNVSLEPHSEATRKDSDPQNFPRASFGVLKTCAKFQDYISTGSTLNREGRSPPPKDTFAHVCIGIFGIKELKFSAKFLIKIQISLLAMVCTI
jgi:hypothetical protein